MSLRLFAATRNEAKLAELSRVFAGLAEVTPATNVPSEDETGDDSEVIARAKAIAWSLSNPGVAVVATDGGLLIPALGDRWHPQRTRRFAGNRVTDAERATAVLALARELRGEERRVGWRESLAVARDGCVLAAWTADSVPGLLAESLDSRHLLAGGGFWVPAVWSCPEYDGRVIAELSRAERASRDDHWARLAVRVRTGWQALSQRLRNAS